MMRLNRHRLVLGVMAGLLCVPAAWGQGDAPPGGRRGGGIGAGGPQRAPRVELTPEQREAAWELEVKGVAAGLDLSEETTAKIVEIYTDARKEHGEALQKVMEELREQFRSRGEGGARDGNARGGGGAGGGVGGGARGERGGGGFAGPGGEIRQKMNELNQSARKDLNAKLDELLDGDALKHAQETLGSLNIGWDGMVHAVSGFGLDEDTQFIVLWAIESYIIDSGKARQSMMTDDRRAAMQEMREAWDKLDEAVKDILTDEQQGELRRAAGGGFAFRGRGGGGV